MSGHREKARGAEPRGQPSAEEAAGTAPGPGAESRREPDGAAPGQCGGAQGPKRSAAAPVRAQTEGREGLSPANGPETGLEALASFNLGCAAASSGGRARSSRGARGSPGSPGRPSSVSRCPLRSALLPLPGAARIPRILLPLTARGIPARPSPLRSRAGSHTAALTVQSRSPHPGIPVWPRQPSPAGPALSRHGPAGGSGQGAEVAELNWQLTKRRFCFPIS